MRRNLVARGYTEVQQDGGVQPDLAVCMAAVSNTIQIYSGSYCYYYSYWYWYYPCYPTYPYYSSYNARTFVMDLVDVKTAETNPPADGGVEPGRHHLVQLALRRGVDDTRSRFRRSSTASTRRSRSRRT